MSQQSPLPGDARDNDSRLPARFEIVEAGVPHRLEGPPVNYYGSPAPEEDPDSGGLLDYWRILRRRKGTLIIGAVAGLLIGIASTLPQTPIYQAKTTLEIQSFNQNFMNMGNLQEVTEGSGPAGNMVDLQTQIKILQSDTLVDRVTAQLSGGTAPAEPAAPGRLAAWRQALNLPEEAATDAKARAVEMAADSLKVRASGQTRIVEVLVDSTDPAVAATFANRLTAEYVEQSMEARWQSSQRTGEWLTRQMDDLRIKLERSEDALQSYAQRSKLVFTGKDTNVDEEKLKQIQDQLTAVQGDRVSKQSRWEMASSAPAETLPDVLNDTLMRGYQEKISDLRRQQQELLETFTPETQRVKRVAAQVASLEKSLEVERAQILRRIRNEYEEALRKERLLQTDYDRQTRLVTALGEKAIQYNILKREVETNRQLYESMLQRVKEAGLASALRASNVRVVDEARAPEFPYKPSLPLNAVLGLLAGGFLAIGFVVTTEKADRALREPSDIPFYLGARELGVVPSAQRIDDGKKRRLLTGRARNEKVESQSLTLATNGLSEKLELVTLQRRLSATAESFRAVLTSILFSGNGHGPPRMIVVTSASPSEGKTTVATNLALAMAETGQRVLLVDGDTRRPRQHGIFEVPNDAGLTDLLKPGDGDWKKLIHESGAPGLWVLPAGPGVAAPSHLLYSKKLRAALDWFREEFDMVVIDTPPMLQIPDARLFGKLVDGVVLVVRANSTTRDAALAARMRLREDGVTLIGTVMNDWDPQDSPGGYYGSYGKYSTYRQYYSNQAAS
ncbi:MAG: polysaccharide biosynthesis tyrosine autokinase [Bryobacteraceae bacterium]|nr:polysaccharide biosynthesis tyrosine autokinase [Bryobacteraceae bacterium]